MVWIIFGLGFNLLLGYGGLPSFGHGAFFGVGAYAFGLAQFNVHPNLWLCLGAAMLAGGVAGALVALFISHRRGIYYALVTIAFGQIFWFVAVKWHSVTRGEDGLLNIKRPPFLDDLNSLYFFCFAVFAVTVVLLWRLVQAPFGLVPVAVTQNVTPAPFIGYNRAAYTW